MSRRLVVLSKGSNGNSASFMRPLLRVRGRMRRSKVDISINPDIRSMGDADCVFVNSKYFRDRYPVWDTLAIDSIRQILKGIRKFTDRVVWFDTSDSTSSNQFPILDCVDLFCKNQIFSDTSNYLKSFYGGRIYTDYYNREFGVIDEICDFDNELYIPPAAELNKIRISWNSAFGQYGHGIRSSVDRMLGHNIPVLFKQLYTLFPPSAERPLDISCRVGLSHKRNSVLFQRQRLLDTITKVWPVEGSRVNRSKYWTELKKSKVVCSPFGWGEIAYRDFEVFLCGGALLKPNLSHMRTWPELYKQDETFISVRWDMSDLQEKVENLLSNRRYKVIAENGQLLYEEAVHSDIGLDSFCGRVEKIAGFKADRSS